MSDIYTCRSQQLLVVRRSGCKLEQGGREGNVEAEHSFLPSSLSSVRDSHENLQSRFEVESRKGVFYRGGHRVQRRVFGRDAGRCKGGGERESFKSYRAFSDPFHCSKADFCRFPRTIYPRSSDSLLPSKGNGCEILSHFSFLLTRSSRRGFPFRLFSLIVFVFSGSSPARSSLNYTHRSV